MNLAVSVKPCGFGLALLLIGMVAAQTAPRANTPPVVACPGIITLPVAITLKNELGQVISGPEERTLSLKARQIVLHRDRPGSWTVSVQRHWYEPATVRNIRVVEDACGPVRPTPLAVYLKPTPDAPRIRKLSIFPATVAGLFVEHWPYYRRYSTFLDAPSVVSRAVVWSSSDPGAATIDPSGMLRSVCSRTPAWTTITATLKADPTVKVSTRFGRGGGGMVCKRGAVDR